MAHVEITAECNTHGRFVVKRKPNKAREGRSVGPSGAWRYDAVKCPKCPWWAMIIEQWLVEDKADPPGDRQPELL